MALIVMLEPDMFEKQPERAPTFVGGIKSKEKKLSLSRLLLFARWLENGKLALHISIYLTGCNEQACLQAIRQPYQSDIPKTSKMALAFWPPSMTHYAWLNWCINVCLQDLWLGRDPIPRQYLDSLRSCYMYAMAKWFCTWIACPGAV